MIFHGHILVEEKGHLIHDLKDELKKTSEHYNKISEMKDMGKREAELHYKQLLNDKQAEYKQTQRNIKDQYQHLLVTKEEQLKTFMREAESYTKDKK